MRFAVKLKRPRRIKQLLMSLSSCFFKFTTDKQTNTCKINKSELKRSLSALSDPRFSLGRGRGDSKVNCPFMFS